MVFTNSDWLPTYEELTVPEVELSSAPLRAGAHHFGKYCDNQSKEFMLCRSEEKDPRKCVREGNEVTRCALEFFKKVKLSCAEEFTEYWKCIDRSSWNMHYKGCRRTQAAFDKCMLDSLGQERPALGYFSKARVHHTQRPKPERKMLLPEPMPDPPKYDGTQPPPPTVEQGSRAYF